MKIDWIKEDSPDIRAYKKGPGVLSSKELLAVMFSKWKGSLPEELAARVIGSGGLRALASCPLTDVAQAVGVMNASRLGCAFEFARRYSFENIREAERIEGADDAYEFLKPRLRDLPHESFGVLFLNQKHGIISYKELFRGTINGSAVHPREVIKEALRENAAAVILAHNHPSGNTIPSPEDIALTEQLETLLGQLDVRTIDHILVGGNGYYSFAREGLLPSKKKKLMCEPARKYLTNNSTDTILYL